MNIAGILNFSFPFFFISWIFSTHKLMIVWLRIREFFPLFSATRNYRYDSTLRHERHGVSLFKYIPFPICTVSYTVAFIKRRYYRFRVSSFYPLFTFGARRRKRERERAPGDGYSKRFFSRTTSNILTRKCVIMIFTVSCNFRALIIFAEKKRGWPRGGLQCS